MAQDELYTCFLHDTDEPPPTTRSPESVDMTDEERALRRFADALRLAGTAHNLARLLAEADVVDAQQLAASLLATSSAGKPGPPLGPSPALPVPRDLRERLGRILKVVPRDQLWLRLLLRSVQKDAARTEPAMCAIWARAEEALRRAPRLCGWADEARTILDGGA